MLPRALTPLFFGQLAKKGVWGVYNIFFFEIADDFKQTLFFFLKILFGTGHDKRSVGRQAMFEWLVIVKHFFSDRSEKETDKTAGYFIFSQSHANRYLQMRHHLRYIHFAPLRR